MIAKLKIMHFKLHFFIPLTFWACFLSINSFSQENSSKGIEELAKKFNEPEQSAKPWVYWMWMNGNISAEGITNDLQAMHDVGIGGVMMFNIGMNPEGKIHYRTKEWMDMVRHAAVTAHKLGIKFVFHNCDGWGSSGGPWVTKENAMKKIVYSETKIAGGELYNQAVPLPKINLDYYKDIAILAFPTPAKDIRVPNISGKAGNTRDFNLTIGKEIVSVDAMIKSTDILDLSKYFTDKGILNWKAPAGKFWTILRIGYTPTGSRNGPATKYGVGLECDKLSKESLNEHWQLGIQPVINELGTRDLTGILVDSYEKGGGNWTAEMQKEFKLRRGYDLMNWLPVISGRYINSGAETESFLWDFRKTIAELLRDNFYNHFVKLANDEGLNFYVEPYEGPYDSLQVASAATELLGECWTNGEMIHWNKVASSSAHIHGIKLVGSEVFTEDAFNGRWQEHPRVLKSLGDRVWSEGVNHFIIHRYAHQPWQNVRPGQSLGSYGSHFERTNTWWKQSKAWISYITRAQQVLQEGRFVADIALIADEGMPSHVTYRPDIKLKGYDYDLISAKYFSDFQYIGNEFVLPGGARYKALIFPDNEYLTLGALEKIKQLTDAGATIFAPRPISSPSRSDYTDQKIYDELVNEVFNEKKKVIWTNNFNEIVDRLGISPDFEVCDSSVNTAWIHRTINNDHIYFVSNQMKEPVDAECKFRVKNGYAAEIWKPETGAIIKTEYAYSKDNRVMLKLQFQPEESYFIVFKEMGNTLRHDCVAIKKAGGRAERRISPLPELNITSAQFGIFEIKLKNMVDVTHAVRKNVKNNGLSVLSQNHLGGDSAPGNMKTLWVEYRQDGKIFNAFTLANKRLEIAPSEKRLEILRALYGILPKDMNNIPHYYSIDISNEVKGLLENGQLKFKPIDILKDEIRDDIPRQVKISYLADGAERVLVADMNEMVHLPLDVWRSLQPFPELTYRDAKQFAMVWESGQYELDKGTGSSRNILIDNVPEEKAIKGDWLVHFPGVTDIGKPEVFNDLHSYTANKNENIKYFSGTASYNKEINISEESFSEGLDIWLDLGRVECIAEVSINGKRLKTLWKEPYRINITGVVNPGVNKLKVDVTNLLVNRLIGDEQYPADYKNGYPAWLKDSSLKRESPRQTFSVVKLWQQDDELKESGLLGPVVLKFSKKVAID